MDPAMTLTLYSHPLASYCHKVLIALYENATSFTAERVDFANPGSAAQFLDLWPVGKMPVLHDSATAQTIPESTIILEYLDQHHFHAVPMLPGDPDPRLQTRLWDRFFDLHVQDPMQRIVFDRLRPADVKDPTGVAEARQKLRTAYDMVEHRMTGRRWVAADAFTMADCAAVPALFFAGIIEPFSFNHRNLIDYFDRLLARPSVQRVLDEARPFFQYFPFVDHMPDHFLKGPA